MFKILLLSAIALCLITSGVLAQGSTDEKTRELVAALDKTKYKKKEKANISVEVYVDIKNEPALRSDRSEYSGTYDSDGYRLDLTVRNDGSAGGSGYDTLIGSEGEVSFTLKDAHVDGALLTATKVYNDGRTEPFEAVFVNRTARAGTRPDAINTSETKFGLGFIIKESNSSGVVGGMTSRVFLEKR